MVPSEIRRSVNGMWYSCVCVSMKTLLLDLCMMRKIIHFKCGSASFLQGKLEERIG